MSVQSIWSKVQIKLKLPLLICSLDNPLIAGSGELEAQAIIISGHIFLLCPLMLMKLGTPNFVGVFLFCFVLHLVNMYFLESLTPALSLQNNFQFVPTSSVIKIAMAAHIFSSHLPGKLTSSSLPQFILYISGISNVLGLLLLQ